MSRLPATQSSFRDGLQPRSSDVFIAIMGVTGAGKSTFISRCCERKIAIGHNLQACTMTVDVYPCPISSTTTVYLIDTPGFDDTNRSDTEVLREIATWLTDSYTAQIRLNGIIYLHRISDVRMQGSAKKNLFMFKKLCGPNALKNVILATTMWDRVSEREGIARENELRSTPEFWGWMEAQGSRVHRHSGDKASALQLIQSLIKDKAEVTLELQQQMVIERKTLDETDAGKELQAEIVKERKKFEKSLVEVQEQLKEALQARDKDSVRAMAELQKEYNDRMTALENNTQQLRIGMEKLHKEKYESLEAKLQQRERQHQEDMERLEREKQRRETELTTEKEEAERKERVAQARLQSLSLSSTPKPLNSPGRSGSLTTPGNIDGSEVSLSIVGNSYVLRGPRRTIGAWLPLDNMFRECSIDHFSNYELRIMALGLGKTWMIRKQGSIFTECDFNIFGVYPNLSKHWDGIESLHATAIVLGTDGNYLIKGTKRTSWYLNSDIANHVAMDDNAPNVDVCALGRQGAYLITFYDGRCFWNLKGHYRGLEDSLRKNQNRGHRRIRVAALSLTDDDHIVVYQDGSSRVSTTSTNMNRWRMWVKANFGSELQ